MEMVGDRRIEAPRQLVWDALNDPAVLKASIPGCESVERTGEDSFQANAAIRLGPMSAKFGAKVKLTNVNAPESYTITGEGNGGAMGFAKGGADVKLVESTANVTILSYTVRAQVGGKMAQLGARLIDTTAKQMADQFFDRFAAQLNVAPPEIATGSAAARPTENPAMAASAGFGQMVAQMAARVPANPLGMPLVFWIGSVAMLGVLVLLFLL